MRRLLPSALLGVLGVATGLGVGLGLAYAPTRTATHGQVSTGVFTATWNPPGVTIIGDKAECPQPPAAGPGPEVPPLPAGSHHAISYLYGRCSGVSFPPAVSDPGMESEFVNGRQVLFIRTSALWASWAQNGYNFSLSSVGVPKNEVLRFIAGLRAT